MDELRLRSVVASVLDRWPSAGLAVAVVRDGEPPWFLGHGTADIASQAPVTPDTVFRIGSLTKTITAVAVLQLWEQGLVDLDAPANDYLRTFRLVPSRARLQPATVRHLLTHTAGVGYWPRWSDLLRPGVGAGVSGRAVRALPELYRRGLPVEVEPAPVAATRWSTQSQTTPRPPSRCSTWPWRTSSRPSTSSPRSGSPSNTTTTTTPTTAGSSTVTGTPWRGSPTLPETTSQSCSCSNWPLHGRGPWPEGPRSRTAPPRWPPRTGRRGEAVVGAQPRICRRSKSRR
jgi:hypothetical protein